jgi:hypothetical protein
MIRPLFRSSILDTLTHFVSQSDSPIAHIFRSKDDLS